MINLAEKVKESPVGSTIIALGLLAGAVTGTVRGLDVIDELVMTHAEHALDAEMFTEELAAAQEAIGDMKLWNRCDRLERRMETLQDRIFNMEQQGVIEDQIRPVRQDYARVQAQYTSLNCAVVLAG